MRYVEREFAMELHPETPDDWRYLKERFAHLLPFDFVTIPAFRNQQESKLLQNPPT